MVKSVKKIVPSCAFLRVEGFGCETNNAFSATEFYKIHKI